MRGFSANTRREAAAVQGQLVFIGIDRDRSDAQLVGCTHDTDGNFATVGNQQAFDGSGHRHRPSGDGSLARCIATFADYTAITPHDSVHATSRCLNRHQARRFATKTPFFQRRNTAP